MPQLDPDRWRAASLQLDEALDLPDEERTRWLAALHEQDPVVADDVRVLLEEHELIQRKQFLETQQAFRQVARVEKAVVNVAAPPPLSAGRVFGAYKLVSPIGQGGMGVVWLAERCDGAFEGRAAIKLLDVGRFARSEARFRREANILARLSHHNIAHLIDAGVSSDGQPYLVLELVDGQPIDRACDARTLDVPARIRLFLDVLDAVSHAHAHRIVHRDIKPSNVLVRTDGHVKLLDFGIAKLLEREGEPSTATTLTLDQGMALTPAYAAPEQVQARPVTTVTDVYALGVLLYVLLTGRHPCGDDLNSPVNLLKAIVDIDPPLASAAVVAAGHGSSERLQKLLKGDLDTIIAKTLKKDPGDRYQSVAELTDDLRRYLASEPIRARRESTVSRTARLVRRNAALTAVGTIAALALGAAAVFYAMRPVTEPARVDVTEPRAPTPVTSEAGEEHWPSLSPDRMRVAFSWTAPNSSASNIALKTLSSAAVVRLTDGPANDTMPIWSPDGRQIAFLRSFREPEHRTQICLISATGAAGASGASGETGAAGATAETPRVLHTAGFSLPGLSWWKERNALLFASRRAETGVFHLAALDLATLEVRLLTNPPSAPLLSAPGDRLPAVSPDGRIAAFVRETHEGQDIFLLDLVTNSERRLTRDHHRIFGITWSADGQAVILSSARSGVDALYRVALADGAIARVPQTGDGASQPMAGPGGLVFSQTLDDSNIYRVDLRDGRALGPPRPIITSSRSDNAPHISPDGKSIAFLSTRGGGQDIWVASADGTNPRRLTSLPIASGPRWSPDGRSIAFAAIPAEGVRPDIWVVDVSGGAPRRLVTDPSWDTVLAWAADGAALYFMSDRSGGFEVWKMPVRGGAPTQVTKRGGLRAQESPDGRFLYYANDVPEVWRRALHAPSTSTSPSASWEHEKAKVEELVTRFPTGTHWGGDWIVGVRGLYSLGVRESGPVTIDFLPFTPRGSRPMRVASLTAPPAPSVSVFAVAPDESWLVWAQDDYRNSDIMMVTPR